MGPWCWGPNLQSGRWRAGCGERQGSTDQRVLCGQPCPQAVPTAPEDTGPWESLWDWVCIPPAGSGLPVTTHGDNWGVAGPGLDNGEVLGLNKGAAWCQPSRRVGVSS